MENIYLNNSEPDNIYDGPTDEELKRIEEELEKYSNEQDYQLHVLFSLMK